LITGGTVAGLCRVRREESKLGQKRGWSSTIGKCSQRAKRVFLPNSEPGTYGVRVDANAFELVEQIREPFRL
jgi:hypothetical protein